ncbi:MAG: spondin domain-containing protein [Planctomycetes bacterium]|nr:spondin domain-containing protein [Planctomycetota bacterium]
MKKAVFAVGLVGALGTFVAGCGSDRSSSGRGVTTAPVASNTPAVPASQRFEVVIENLSGETFLPTPFAPAAWAVHQSGVDPFVVGAPASAGLEALAEDGGPTAWVAELASTPGVTQQAEVGATPPGQVTRFEFSAEPGRDERLSLASMLVQSNDAFVSGSLELFDAQGNPVTQQLALTLYDAGTEVNEVPGAGAYQPARQPAPNMGPAEGTVHLANHAVRAFPPAGQLVQVDVRLDAGDLVFTLTNTGEATGVRTPLAPVFWASHTAAWRAFEPGQPAPANGLTTLAEDGSPADLVTFAASEAAIGAFGAAAVTLERPTAPPGPAMPGERFEVRLTPDAAFPRLTLLAMIVESNDAFVSLGAEGLELFDATGALRPASELEAEARRSLALWDAGSEANQVPGAGAFQPARQPGPNTGPADADPTVRLYADGTNDLAGPQAGGVIDVTVSAGPAAGELTLTLTNTSGGKILAPAALILHEAGVRAFEPGQRASAGLERLAEDGNPSDWVAELAARPGVGSASVANTPVGAAAPGPLRPGSRYQAVLTPAAGARFLSLASMIVPTNDSFVATQPGGVELLTAGGTLRAPALIEAELRQALRAWDAGSEANQVGAAGPDQAPRQAAPNTGGDEGTGLVRPFADPVWSYPPTDRLIRITVRPLP